MFQSPRHRGTSSTRPVGVPRPPSRPTFQSPRHRGTSSTASRRENDGIQPDHVSIPSSSGHVFDRGRGDVPLPPLPYRFNPLVIGARLRPTLPRPEPRPCSVSFNPLVIGARLRPRRARRYPRRWMNGFNPLVIGARLRPYRRSDPKETKGKVSIPSSSGHVFDRSGRRAKRPAAGFNPLVIGARLRPDAPVSPSVGAPARFQSPRHRGTSSTAGPMQPPHRRNRRFNPLVIGARLRPR